MTDSMYLKKYTVEVLCGHNNFMVNAEITADERLERVSTNQHNLFTIAEKDHMDDCTMWCAAEGCRWKEGWESDDYGGDFVD